MGSALIIVWRESLEAVLVVAVLYVWLRNQGSGAGLRWLGFGVLGGLALAGGLGAAMLGAQSRFAAGTVEWMQTLAVFVAAVLIVQMILWMREHARGLKRELESGAAQALRAGNLARIALLAAVAVGREGAETVLFLYGLLLERSGAQLTQVGGGAAAGLALGLATFWLLSRGVRWMSWRSFFAASEILLLVFAGSLAVTGVDRLVASGAIALDSGPLWDSSWLLGDTAGAGGMLSQFAGYRAQPNIAELAAWGAYWLVVAALMHRRRIFALWRGGGQASIAKTN